MKKLFITLSLLLCTLAVQAQEPQPAADSLAVQSAAAVEPAAPATAGQRLQSMRELRREARREAFSLAPKHEVRLSAGAYGQPGYNPMGEGYFSGLFINYDALNRHSIYDSYGYSQWDFEGSKCYRGAQLYSGTYSLGYLYRATPVVGVGMTVSYSALGRNLYSNADNSTVGRDVGHYVSFVAMVRFSWLNRKWVSLYSALGLGFGIGVERTNNGLGSVRRETLSCFTGQYTPIGITVGRRLYGFAELGLGAQGSFICGIGYRIGNYNRK